MFLNKLQLIGFLGSNPELNTTPGGKKTVTVSVASTEVWKDAEGKRQEHTEWTPVVFWGKDAENVCKRLTKGSALYVEGRKRTREYLDKKGSKQRVVELISENWQDLDRTQGTVESPE